MNEKTKKDVLADLHARSDTLLPGAHNTLFFASNGYSRPLSPRGPPTCKRCFACGTP